MGLFSFIKNAGEKVFGGAETPEEKAGKVQEQVAKQGFDLSGVTFSTDGDKIVVAGQALDIKEKQKILATAGNIDGVEGVEDQLTLKTPLRIEIPDLSKTMYTVKSGDSLSKIAKEVYGDPMQYPKIFEANKPMLKHEDKIYPGQVLYIPQD